MSTTTSTPIIVNEHWHRLYVSPILDAVPADDERDRALVEYAQSADALKQAWEELRSTRSRLHALREDADADRLERFAVRDTLDMAPLRVETAAKRYGEACRSLIHHLGKAVRKQVHVLDSEGADKARRERALQNAVANLHHDQGGHLRRELASVRSELKPARAKMNKLEGCAASITDMCRQAIGVQLDPVAFARQQRKLAEAEAK